MAWGSMGIMPGEHDWMNQWGYGGIGGISAMDRSGFPAQSGGLLGAGSQPSGLLGKAQSAMAPFGGMTNVGLALLANSGYSTQKRGLGEILGTSLLQARQMGQQSSEDDLTKRYREAQIDALGREKNQPRSPASVQEYEYAKANGFEGSFQDWVVAGGQSSRPSSVQEWEFYNKLPEDQKKLYLEMKRNPNFQVKDVNQVPTVIAPSYVGGTQTTPLSSLPQEAAAAAEKKRAETEGGKIGEAQGTIVGGVLTKGSNAQSTVGTLDLAEPLIDIATGSQAGAARDKVAAVFGEAPTGAQAIAQLKVLQANLMTSMPRMEGPQSDRDVQLYREAAGQIGDPTVPAPIKKAAVKTIRSIQERYIQRAGGSTAKPGSKPQETRSLNGKTYVKINGQWYEQ